MLSKTEAVNVINHLSGDLKLMAQLPTPTQNYNFLAIEQVTDDEEFAKFFLDWLFERYRNEARE